MSCENNENHENLKIPYENQEKQKKIRIRLENKENHANHIIP